MNVSDNQPEKIYIEISNRCNLDCRTCMRNSWEEPLGSMEFSLFQGIIEESGQFASPPLIFIGGIGEPLGHPQIIDMVHLAKNSGCRVEMISNGILLSEGMDRELMNAGLDCLWVSIDGARPESYADIRLGNHLPEILTNLHRFQILASEDDQNRCELGISFVAMKRNISDLPRIVDIAESVKARRFSISNVEAYTREMLKERLYPETISQEISGAGIQLPRFDPGLIDEEILRRIRTEFVTPMPSTLPRSGACPFALRKSLSIRWDGRLSPCLPLLHSHTVHFEHYSRYWSEYHFGSLKEKNLTDFILEDEVRDFRQKLDAFEFAPCLSCNGCDLPGINGEDCFGNLHPACGGCLWSQGFIVCP